MNSSPLRAAIARIPCASPRSVTAAPALATCCTNGIEARASGSRLGAAEERAGSVGCADDVASAWLSATGIAPGAGSVQSGMAAARAGDQAGAARMIRGRIETSVAGDLTMVVRFANGEHRSRCRLLVLIRAESIEGNGRARTIFGAD